MLDEEFPILARERGITSVKLFMTCAHGVPSSAVNLILTFLSLSYSDLRLSDAQILDVMLAGRKHGITIVRVLSCLFLAFAL